MSERDYAPLSIACVRGLCDKIYEKRKFAGGEIEKMVKDFSDANNTSQIRRLIKVLGQDLMSSTNPNVKNGALMGLSSVAVGLGKGCTEYMTELIHPIIACFSESESRVRYQAAEALFNVVKIARGASLAHFPIIFDALARLAADSEPQVKQAAELLDRLVKDIVSESSGLEAGALVSLVRARLYARGAAARQFVAAWVAVLDAVPGLDLLPHLPQLLDGLFLMLDDPAPEIRRMVEVQLGEFLRSIRQQPERAHFQQMLNILITHAMASDELTQLTAITWLKEFVEVCGRGVLPQLSGVLASVLPCLAYTDEPRKSIRETAATVNLQLTKLVGEYCHSVTRSKPDTQLSAKQTTEDQARGETDKVSHTHGSNITAKESAVPRSGDSKGVADAKGSGSSATDALPPRSGEPKDGHTQAPKSEAVEGSDTAEGSDSAVSKEDEQLNLDAVVAVLTQMLHRSSVHTKVAALDWILHLYNKLPDEMYVETDSVFVCVVGSLTDASDDVVRRALAVLAEICSCAPHAGDLESSPYYYKFLQALLRLLAADENLLEDRGAFIIRQLCVLLAAEDVYRALARILAAERNLRFAATAVSVLASILLTAAELYDLRARLRTATDQSTRELIVCLYRCWSHAPVALLALCLLTHHYAHCNQLIATFGDLEITVDFLTEVDKLVQLIESPIFAYLRLELLGGAGSAALRGALYGVLMLLPQGDAFHALRRRLQAAPPDRCLPQAACESQGAVPEAELRELLAEFRRVQAAHRQHRALDRPRRPDC